MHNDIRKIIEDYNPSLFTQLEDALNLRVTNFKRDLYPSLEKIDQNIPGAGLQYVIWIDHEAKYPFPGFNYDPISRPMRYIPSYLATGTKLPGMARLVAYFSGSHIEDCMKAYCEIHFPSEPRYLEMPVGTLARQQPLINALGIDISESVQRLASILVNKAKHKFRGDSSLPVVSLQDAIGGYFASRILGFQILQKAGLLDSYLQAIHTAFEQGNIYTLPDEEDMGDDEKPWPLKSEFPEDELDC